MKWKLYKNKKKVRGMRYVVIEDFNGLINLVIDPKDGMTKVFDTKENAQIEADNCQNGIVVNLGN